LPLGHLPGGHQTAASDESSDELPAADDLLVPPRRALSHNPIATISIAAPGPAYGSRWASGLAPSPAPVRAGSKARDPPIQHPWLAAQIGSERRMVKLSGRDALRRPSGARREHVVRDQDEVERVFAVVADLYHGELVVGLHDRPDRSGRPAPRADHQLHHIQNLVPRICSPQPATGRRPTLTSGARSTPLNDPGHEHRMGRSVQVGDHPDDLVADPK